MKQDCFVKLPTGKPFEAEVPGRVVFPDFLKEKARTWGNNHKTLFRAGFANLE